MTHKPKSELSKCRLNDVCCKCTVRRWKGLELAFPLMYSTCKLCTVAKLSLEGALHGTALDSIYIITRPGHLGTGIPLSRELRCDRSHWHL